MKYKNTYFLVIAALLIGQDMYGQTRAQKFDTLLTNLYNNGNFNGNVLVAEKGKVIYKKSFGFSNESTKSKLNENSIFELASVSKQFTAMAIVMLKERGKLSYDDKMSKHLPELSHYANITIRNLLNHTSGLPDYGALMDTTFNKTKIATNADLVTAFAKYKPEVLFQPNTKWEYSNLGYDFLASIVEKVSGMSYGDYLTQAIFKPLKMKNTFVYTRRYAPKKVANYAFGYVYSDSLKKYVLPDETDEYKFVVWLDGIVGEQAVNSTTIDLLKWDRALYANKLISKESKKEIFTPAVLSDKSKTEYGFGWEIQDNGVYGNIVKHDGSWPGYGTFIDRHIDSDKTIIVLMNYQNYTNESTQIPLSEIRKILYNIEPIKYIELNPNEIELFAGEYKGSTGKILKFTYENGKLYRPHENGNIYELKAISKTKFHMKKSNPDIFYEFIIIDNKVVKCISTQPEFKVVKESIKQ
jgi:CubicO group peptidase (beta-lactamase class C family)